VEVHHDQGFVPILLHDECVITYQPLIQRREASRSALAFDLHSVEADHVTWKPVMRAGARHPLCVQVVAAQEVDNLALEAIAFLSWGAAAHSNPPSCSRFIQKSFTSVNHSVDSLAFIR
jgi:hypothetical protein